MGKLIKYEMKGISKFLLGVLLVLVIASSLIQYNIFRIVDANDGLIMNPMSTTFIVTISMLVIFGTSLVSFFYIVNSFKNELSEDRGYLTFTLPLSGSQIVGAKLTAAGIWSFILTFVLVVYNVLLGYLLLSLGDIDIWAELSMIFYGLNLQSLGNFLLLMINSLVQGALTLLLVYFSMSLRRVSFGGKRMDGLWFIIFLVLSGITGYISIKAAMAYPYLYDLGLNKIRLLSDWEVVNMGTSNVVANGIMIMNFVTSIIFSILAFLGTAYLIDEKIDI